MEKYYKVVLRKRENFYEVNNSLIVQGYQSEISKAADSFEHDIKSSVKVAICNSENFNYICLNNIFIYWSDSKRRCLFPLIFDSNNRDIITGVDFTEYITNEGILGKTEIDIEEADFLLQRLEKCRGINQYCEAVDILIKNLNKYVEYKQELINQRNDYESHKQERQEAAAQRIEAFKERVRSRIKTTSNQN